MKSEVFEKADVHAGSQVRLRRLELGMSQSDLADGLGITFQQIQKYEKGFNRMGAGRLQQISKILHVPIAYFFCRECSSASTRGRCASHNFGIRCISCGTGGKSFSSLFQQNS